VHWLGWFRHLTFRGGTERDCAFEIPFPKVGDGGVYLPLSSKTLARHDYTVTHADIPRGRAS
jgi:hypothetical protein